MVSRVEQIDDEGCGHRGIGPEEAYQKLVAGMVFVKQIMEDKSDNGEKD